jgi:hypothetical protein
VAVAGVAGGLLLWARAGFGSPGFIFFIGPVPMLAYALATVVQASSGVVLAARRPANPVGWLTLLFGLDIAVGALIFGGVPFLRSHGANDLADWLAWLYTWLTLPSAVLISVVIGFLFPTGKLISPRWRVAVIVATIGAILTAVSLALSPGHLILYPGVTNPLTGAGGGYGPAIITSFVILILAAPLTGYTLTRRYAVASHIVQLQVRWFVTLSLGLEITFVAFIAAMAFLPPDAPLGTAIISALFLTAALPPVALFFAILRYRLYDIDTIISRAVVYGALVAVLGGVYAASMGIINRLFLEVFGEPNDAAVVLETLILVTISAPLKPWLDKFVERHFGQAPKPHEHHELLADPAFSAALDARIAQAVAKARDPGTETKRTEPS